MKDKYLNEKSYNETLLECCKKYGFKDARSFADRLRVWKVGFDNHYNTVDNIPTPLQATQHYELLSKTLIKLEKILDTAPQILHNRLGICTMFPSPESKAALEKHGIVRDQFEKSKMELSLFWAQVATLSIRAKEIVQENENYPLDYEKPNKTVADLGREADKNVIRNARNFWIENGYDKFKPYYSEGKPKNAAAYYLIEVFALLDTDTTISNIETAIKALKKAQFL